MTKLETIKKLLEEQTIALAVNILSVSETNKRPKTIDIEKLFEKKLKNLELIYWLVNKLEEALKVLNDLKHHNHHKIEEEVWRIDNFLEGLEE